MRPSVSDRIAAASDVEYSFCVIVAMPLYYRMEYPQSTAFRRLDPAAQQLISATDERLAAG